MRSYFRAVTREAKSQSSLIALARTRRMQRAVEHAYVHHGAPMPTLRTSLGFMMSTACTADDAPAEHGHRMRILGVDAAERVVYVVEDLGAGEAPIAYRLYLDGPRAGHLVPIRALYEQCDDAAELHAHLADLAARLAPVARTTTEAWMLSTRVVQRRALRVPGHDLPLRKFALQLRVEPVTGHGAVGHTTVTAFLRPHAVLADMWLTPGGQQALARVTYTGVPSGPGETKDTIILLSD